MSDFVDPETHSNNMTEGVTFKQIVLMHLQRITMFASVEWRGGYWEQRPVNMNGITSVSKVYVSDSREVYSNAVECLADLLLPHFDEEMVNAEFSLREELEAAYNENMSGEDKSSSLQNYRVSRVKINRKLLRELTKFLYRKNYLNLGVLEE